MEGDVRLVQMRPVQDFAGLAMPEAADWLTPEEIRRPGCVLSLEAKLAVAVLVGYGQHLVAQGMRRILPVGAVIRVP